MRRPAWRTLHLAAAALALTAAPLVADEQAKAIRKAIQTLKPSVYRVWYRQKSTRSRFNVILEDDMGGTRTEDDEQVCLGMAVNPSGLILVGGHIFPDPYTRGVDAGIISLTRQKSQPRDFRVEVAGEKLPARLVVHDKELNVALLRIQTDKPLSLPPLHFDEQATLALADRFHVLTMLGEKYDFELSFRSGRVRAVVGKERQRYLQNAVTQFSGVSRQGEQMVGGPVFDDRGRVIGIMGLEPARPPKEKRTTGLDPREVATRVFIGSIRSQRALILRAAELVPLIRNPLRNEKAKGWLGLQELQLLTWGMRRHLGLRRGAGLLVSLVGHDSPAARAGIRNGDLLLRVGDLRVLGKTEEDLQALRRHIRHLPVGQPVEVEVRRGAASRGVEATPEVRPKNVYEAEEYENETLGIGVKEITYDMIERKNLDPEDRGGAYVTKVPFGGFFSLAAARTGEMIRVGDIVLRVGAFPVRSVGDFQRAFEKLEKQKTKEVLVKVKRHADTRFLKVKLDWK